MRKYLNLNIELTINSLLQKLENEKFMLLQEDEENFVLSWGTTRGFEVKSKTELRELDRFIRENHGLYLFGYLSYELKNLFETGLHSKNRDHHNFPLAHFFVPDHVLFCKAGSFTYFGEKEQDEVEQFLNLPERMEELAHTSVTLVAETSKENYLKNVQALKEEIQFGNIYEINYCVNFRADETEHISGRQLYQKLFQRSEAPFSVFYNHPNHQIISASPERFIRKENQRLISQPIKGTAKRGTSEEEDEQIAVDLQKDPKERSENIMITDLVRNDLSKVASKNSVQVEGLCELKSFKTVHQLVSTISCQLKEQVQFTDILSATFPMGSMTGAPKISAMEHSEKFETFRRGIYSGSVGYIEPNGNFDFNVIIRSFLRNREDGTLTAAVGGAITIESDPEKEYEECLLKLNALQEVLS